MTAAASEAAMPSSTALLPGVALIEFVGSSGRAYRVFDFCSGQLQPRSRHTRWSTLRQRDWREWVKLGPSTIKPSAGEPKETIVEKEGHCDDD